MNTPAHVVFSLAILGRANAWHYPLAIAVGALLPDLAMMVFYGWHRMIGTTEMEIWTDHYFASDSLWQDAFDFGNSIPLITLALVACLWKRTKTGALMFASMLVHCLADMGLHHNDGHRHFYPFSDWRFQSPLSYWDPAHFGDIVGKLEILMFFALAVWLWRYQPQVSAESGGSYAVNRLNKILIVVSFVYAVYFGFVFVTWM